MDFVTGERSFRAGAGYTATSRPTIVLHRLDRTRSRGRTRAPSLLAIQIGGNFLSAFLTSCIGGSRGPVQLGFCPRLYIGTREPRAPEIPSPLFKAALAILRTTCARARARALKSHECNNWVFRVSRFSWPARPHFRSLASFPPVSPRRVPPRRELCRL